MKQLKSYRKSSQRTSNKDSHIESNYLLNNCLLRSMLNKNLKLGIQQLSKTVTKRDLETNIPNHRFLFKEIAFVIRGRKGGGHHKTTMWGFENKNSIRKCDNT